MMKNNTKINLYLINSNYPYGKTETFLENEIQFLSPFFQKIYVFPQNYPSKDVHLRKVPNNVHYFPVLLDKLYYKRILKFIFKYSPIKKHVLDLIKLVNSGNGHYKNKITRWFLSLKIDRAFYKSEQFNFIKDNIQPEDVLYFYWGGAKSIYAKKFNHAKTFVRLHGREVDFPRNNNYIVLFDKTYENTAVRYLSISNKVRNQLLSYHPKVNVITNRLGTYDYGLNPDPPSNSIIRIVSCSNMIPLKRVHLIIQALVTIKETEVEWIHFGDGILYDEIQIMSQKLSKNVKTVFKGRLSNSEVLKYYRNNYIDMFINTSTYEGVPVSIMEAFSFGIPTFATNVGATNELVNETNGILVQKQFDIQELVNAILYCRKNTHKTKRLNARKTWEDFSNATTNYAELVNLFVK